MVLPVPTIARLPMCLVCFGLFCARAGGMTVIDNFGQSNSTAWPITPKTNGGGALYPDETGLTSVAGVFRGVEFYGANGLTLADQTTLSLSLQTNPTYLNYQSTPGSSAVLDLSYGEALVRNEPSFNLPAATGFKLDFLSYVPPGSGQLTVQGDAYHVVNLAHGSKSYETVQNAAALTVAGAQDFIIGFAADPDFGFITDGLDFYFRVPAGCSFELASISLLTQPRGDANLDGKIDLTDLSIVLNHWGDPTQGWTEEFRRLRNGWSFGPDLCSQ